MPEPTLTVRSGPAPWRGLDADVLVNLPTPAYIYDIAAVRENIGALRDALPAGSALYYSLKANPHPAILRAVLAAGLHAEVCSRGEVDAAVGAGFEPENLLLTGPGKRDADLDHALRLGVTRYSVDSPHAIEQLGRRAARAGQRAHCLLRVNDHSAAAGQGLTMTGVPSQFGADADWISAEPHRFAGAGPARVTGLHLYMGTNLASAADLAEQFAHSLETARQISAALGKAGARISLLDLGGGFGVPFARSGERTDLAGLRGRLRQLLEQTRDWPGPRPSVAFESGRYIAGTAGMLLSRVLDAKISQHRRVVVLDAGINHLGGMSGLRRLRPLAPELTVVTRADDPADLAPTIVSGPLCTPLDSWSRDAELPVLVPGDMVSVPNVGAYGLYASLVAFLGHPLPLEVVVDSAVADDPVREISQLELVRKLRHHGKNRYR